MTDSLPGVEFRPLTIPASINDADAADFVEMIRVRNLVYREINGNGDDDVTPDQLLPHYQPDEHGRRSTWVVLVDGEFVGRAGLDIPLEEGSRLAYWEIELLERVWGRGIGQAAHELIVAACNDEDRSVLQAWAARPEGPEARLDAPTGFGSIPLDHVARFFLALGYTLEQVERMSEYDLQQPRDRVQALHEDAIAHAAGYRVVQWESPTPEEYRDGYAWMKSRMSTDAPAANLEFDEEQWDAARLMDVERRHLEGGTRVLVTAAQHIESGALCAFNELTIGQDPTAASFQEDTLVLKEHRGHRLGMLVKTAGLIRWHELAPNSPKMITYNAEENRPMLEINETIGFVPVRYVGAWKKTLAA